MRYVLLIVCLIISGCTSSLKVSRVDPQDPSTRVGIPYPLLYNQYEIVITRRLTGCKDESNISITTDIKSVSAIPDPKHIFVIDPNSLAGLFKTSEVKVDFAATGAPSALNASADDKTGQVIANVVSTIAKIVGFVAIAGGPSKGEAVVCSAAAIEATNEIMKQTPKVTATNKLVESLTEEVKQLNKKATDLGSNIDSNTKLQLSSKYSQLSTASQRANQEATKLAKLLEVVTYTETKRWPSDGDETSGEFPPLLKVLNSWSPPGKKLDLMQKRLTVYINLSKVNGVGAESKNESVKPELGIPFRQPAIGRIAVCTSANCASDDNKILVEKVDNVLQLGSIYYLPCVSKPFSSIACTYKMNGLGQLENMGTAQKASIAEGLTNSAKEVMTQAVAAKEVQSGAKLKELTADTALLKAKAEKMAAEAELKDPSKTAVLNANVEFLNAQRAEIEAEAALKAARLKVEAN